MSVAAAITVSVPDLSPGGLALWLVERPQRKPVDDRRDVSHVMSDEHTTAAVLRASAGAGRRCRRLFAPFEEAWETCP